MHNRKARVQVKQRLSKKRTFRQSIPQGGLLSMTLFLVFIRDILHLMPKNIQGAIYADNFVLWCSEECITSENCRLQEAFQVTESWARTWLAREGGQLDQKDIYTSYIDEKTIIKTLSKKKNGSSNTQTPTSQTTSTN